MVEIVKKSVSEAKLSKEMCTSPAMHLGDCRNREDPINNDMNVGKGDVILTEIGFGCFKVSVPISLDKGRISFSKLTIGQKHNPNPETSTP
ncbi:hypothetical protein CXB51_034391 [Gossypium anomalum]|uniref:Uncharacterized protein n=1 Tax=Gossypium anomalum TaxID=47600 RepID=A0A8J5Y8F2_9ROSI|nr:hypothetical protein CXB51_034391 [Gossypium anomalum]